MTIYRTEVAVTVYPKAWDSIARSEQVHSWLDVKVSGIAEDLRRAAPVRSGAGRNSISSAVRMGADGWYGTASWDDAHYYMGIQNSRTHWAAQAAQRVRFV
jgi:hypothetical protein